jgi:6-pyruvoyltetrahydropterin/6-carboxytetrahydropterin synthase
MITIERYYDFSYGHRVVGHEGKCAGLHGHNGRVTFVCVAEELDELGRVVDFSVVKSKLCQWLEDNWDHRMLLWRKDPVRAILECTDDYNIVNSIQPVPFNPTAENLAHFLLTTVAPMQMQGTGITVIAVKFEETRKCSAVAAL